MNFVTLLKHGESGEHKIAVDDIVKYEESFHTGNTYLRVFLKTAPFANDEPITVNYNNPGSAITAHINMRRLKAALKKRKVK